MHVHFNFVLMLYGFYNLEHTRVPIPTCTEHVGNGAGEAAARDEKCGVVMRRNLLVNYSDTYNRARKVRGPFRAHSMHQCDHKQDISGGFKQVLPDTKSPCCCPSAQARQLAVDVAAGLLFHSSGSVVQASALLFRGQV